MTSQAIEQVRTKTADQCVITYGTVDHVSYYHRWIGNEGFQGAAAIEVGDHELHTLAYLGLG
ncbi:hypothetical protein D3C78_614540 [compost metagenome]